MGSFLTQQWMMVLGGLAGMVTGLVAWFWSKYLGLWLLAIALVAWGLFVYTYPDPAGKALDPLLPPTFGEPYFRHWAFGLGVVVLLTLSHLGATLYRHRAGDREDGAEGRLADIRAAWREILLQLDKARIDPADRPLYLLLAPDEALAASVIRASGLHPFVEAPAAAEAPIHALATADALYLSCSGASATGGSAPEDASRLEYLCGLIESMSPGRPTLRGIAVLIPHDWASGPDAGAEFVRRTSSIREDLDAIRRTLKVRCPTLTLCCLGESLPGFNDFASRFPEASRHSRSGFTVPVSLGADGPVLHRGMNWAARWFQVWTRELMASRVGEKDGNGRLLSLDLAIRSSRDPLAKLLASALTVGRGAEPVLYRGCYFAACGPTREHQAFVAGFLGASGKGRFHADSPLTTWSREAERSDRDYRRSAWALALVSIAVAAPIWWFGIMARLAAPGPRAIGWSVLVALALAWPIALFVHFPTPREGPKPARS